MNNGIKLKKNCKNKISLNGKQDGITEEMKMQKLVYLGVTGRKKKHKGIQEMKDQYKLYCSKVDETDGGQIVKPQYINNIVNERHVNEPGLIVEAKIDNDKISKNNSRTK